ncbi:PAS domain-containing sensor histidine kinase [Bosea sp. WAO]|uniref:sensor histidine kinase n=1 Tax=Bosea sp. WAO TaxID=406341 RepID=UPI00082F5172|nr:PAS domain-containing sensor histidine kinase [Bosea sp. WAO]
MAAAIAAHDWTTTLGPPENWPAALRVAVGMMVNSHFPKCIVWGPELITIHNDAFKAILGDKPPALGQPFSEVWAEVWQEISPLVEKAYAGEATFIEDFPLVVERYGYPERAWFTFCYSPIRDENGAVLGMIDTVVETTAKMQSERNSRLLNAELAHRMKNVLAMIGAVANQTFRSAGSLEEAQATFGERVAALGEAHAILTQSSWSGAPIRAVIEGALAPHRIAEGRVVLNGPALELGAKQSLTLALAINELTTNAIKYGALSRDGGRVAIAWRAGAPDSEERFALGWSESGGPPVTAPTRKGFGSRLLERVVAQDFQGKVSLGYESAGLRYELETAMVAIANAEPVHSS